VADRLGRCGPALVVVVASALLGVIARSPTASATTSTNASRFAGADRYATAATVAESAFPDGADNAVVASGLNFPDALAASYLAGLFSGPGQSWGGPVLLTDPASASQPMMQALSALHVKTVYIAGGPSAVSDNVQSTIAGTPSTNPAGGNIAVTRLGGAGRYDTDKAIAERFGKQVVGGVGGRPTAIVASGETFPDALAAGPVAFSLTLPVVLTDPTTLSSQAQQILSDLGIAQVLIMGGPSAVSAGVESAINAMGITTLYRADGANRYDTAAKFATYATTQGLNMTDAKVAVATGLNFADALAGGPFAGSNIEPIVLSDPVPPETANFVASESATLAHVDVLGGPLAVSDADVEALEQAAGNATPPPPGHTAHLTDTSNGAQVTVAVGDTVQVNLGASFDGGYQWTFTQAPDPSVVALQSQQNVIRGSPAGSLGAGGTQAFNFGATGKGSTRMVLSYSQGSGPVAATYQLNVVVS